MVSLYVFETKSSRDVDESSSSMINKKNVHTSSFIESKMFEAFGAKLSNSAGSPLIGHLEVIWNSNDLLY